VAGAAARQVVHGGLSSGESPSNLSPCDSSANVLLVLLVLLFVAARLALPPTSAALSPSPRREVDASSLCLPCPARALPAIVFFTACGLLDGQIQGLKRVAYVRFSCGPRDGGRTGLRTLPGRGYVRFPGAHASTQNTVGRLPHEGPRASNRTHD